MDTSFCLKNTSEKALGKSRYMESLQEKRNLVTSQNYSTNCKGKIYNKIIVFPFNSSHFSTVRQLTTFPMLPCCGTLFVTLWYVE